MACTYSSQGSPQWDSPASVKTNGLVSRDASQRYKSASESVDGTSPLPYAECVQPVPSITLLP